MQNNFIENMQNALRQLDPNVSVTENGATGYRTTGNALLDLNFSLSSMRNWPEDRIWKGFLKAYNENPALSVVWLFFARDIRGGCGERRMFRVILPELSFENPDLVIRLLPLISEYGRWDDLLELCCGHVPCRVRDAAFDVFKQQLDADIRNAKDGKPISLLAKWVYSGVTSSVKTRRKAEILRSRLGYTPRKYRKTFADLRRYLDITEQKMSSNEWGEINYSAVPSKAGVNYRGAFMRHDGGRYNEYLSDVRSGKESMNASAVFPYEIVHAYMNNGYYQTEVGDYDETLELKWANLPDVGAGSNTLVVVDGSGSMGSRVGQTGITCHDVARSIGIYFAEHMAGPFRNRFITFSAKPKLVGFDGAKTLKSKLEILVDEDDCSNTNIEKTFDLILETAVMHHLRQEDLPENILIVSDMEFDSVSHYYDWEEGRSYEVDQTLFDAIADRWNVAGYKLPRLVFWNVCSRTGTIPVIQNDFGVALVSGFSPNIFDMVMSGELDPWKCLADKLMSDRYEPVRKVVMPS